MKKYRHHTIILKWFLIILLLPGASIHSFAQASPDTTFVVPADSVVASDEEELSDEEYNNVEKLPDTIALRAVPDSTVKRLQGQPSFGYANDPEYWLKNPKDENARDFWYYVEWIFTNPYLRPVLFLLMGGILVYALYRIIVGNNLFLFPGRKLNKATHNESETAVQEASPDLMIAKAIEAGDYRLAIRWLYIQSLQKLNVKGLVVLHPQATNVDYLNQLVGHPAAIQFNALTRIYEYVWYGEFDPGADQFHIIHKHFNNFSQYLGN